MATVINSALIINTAMLTHSRGAAKRSFPGPLVECPNWLDYGPIAASFLEGNKGKADARGTCSTILMHNSAVPAKQRTVRRSVTLPVNVAIQVRRLSRRRRLSANRVLVELIQTGLESTKQKEKAFFDLAKRFRAVG